MNLADLRKNRGVSQTEVARKMGTQQGQISRIEHQTNIKISTLRAYVEALGGRLELMVTFPDGTMIALNIGRVEEGEEGDTA